MIKKATYALLLWLGYKYLTNKGGKVLNEYIDNDPVTFKALKNVVLDSKNINLKADVVLTIKNPSPVSLKIDTMEAEFYVVAENGASSILGVSHLEGTLGANTISPNTESDITIPLSVSIQNIIRQGGGLLKDQTIHVIIRSVISGVAVPDISFKLNIAQLLTDYAKEKGIDIVNTIFS